MVEEEIGRVLTADSLVSQMVENEWGAVRNYLTYIMQRKEEYERQWTKKNRRGPD